MSFLLQFVVIILSSTYHWKIALFCKSDRKMFKKIFRFEQYDLVEIVEYASHYIRSFAGTFPNPLLEISCDCIKVAALLMYSVVTYAALFTG